MQSRPAALLVLVLEKRKDSSCTAGTELTEELALSAWLACKACDLATTVSKATDLPAKRDLQCSNHVSRISDGCLARPPSGFRIAWGALGLKGASFLRFLKTDLVSFERKLCRISSSVVLVQLRLSSANFFFNTIEIFEATVKANSEMTNPFHATILLNSSPHTR